MVYRFGEFEVDIANFGLSRSGEQVDLEPKVFDLLSYLLANRERLVPRGELFDKLWPGRVISDTSLSNQVKAARRALGDSGRDQAYIKTVHGRGYRFVAPVEEIADAQSLAGPAEMLQVSVDRRAGPMVTVLPFQNLSGDPDQDFFCEGISEDITTELSRFPDIQVIARHSAFQFASAGYDIGELVRRFGTDYIVEGSVRRNGGRARMSVQLIDGVNQEHIWAERYEFQLEKIFDVQDDIIGTVVSTMTSQIRRIEMDRAQARSTRNLNAYEHLLCGLSHHKHFWPKRDDFMKAHAEFDKAIALDSRLARAHAWRVCSLSGVRDYYTREFFDEYIDMCRFALTLDSRESETHRILGSCYFTLGDFDLGKHHMDFGRELSPNDSHMIAKSAKHYIQLGEIEQARKLIERAMHLNPLHPGWYWTNVGMTEFFNGSPEAAVASMRKNTHPGGYELAWLAAAYMASDDREHARQTAAQALNLDSEASISKFDQWEAYRDADQKERLDRYMVEAGIPR